MVISPGVITFWKLALVPFGAKAGLTIGFSIDGRLAGCAAFANTRREIDWRPEIVSRLSLVTRVFANAIARQRSDRALREAHAEVKRLGEQLKVVFNDILDALKK